MSDERLLDGFQDEAVPAGMLIANVTGSIDESLLPAIRPVAKVA